MKNAQLALGIAATLSQTERRQLVDAIRALSGPARPGVRLSASLIPTGATVDDIVAVTNAVQLLALSKIAQGVGATELDDVTQSLVTGSPVLTTPERAAASGLVIPPETTDIVASLTKDANPEVADAALALVVGAVLGEEGADEDDPFSYEGDPDSDELPLTLGDILEGGVLEGGLFRKKDGTKRKLIGSGVKSLVSNVVSKTPVGAVLKEAQGVAKGLLPAGGSSAAGGKSANQIAGTNSLTTNAISQPRGPRPSQPEYKIPIPWKRPETPDSNQSVAEASVDMQKDLTALVTSIAKAEKQMKDSAINYANIRRNHARVMTARSALTMPDAVANVIAQNPIDLASLDAMTVSVLPFVQASGNQSVADWWRNFSSAMRSAVSGGAIDLTATPTDTMMKVLKSGDVEEATDGEPIGDEDERGLQMGGKMRSIKLTGKAKDYPAKSSAPALDIAKAVTGRSGRERTEEGSTHDLSGGDVQDLQDLSDWLSASTPGDNQKGGV